MKSALLIIDVQRALCVGDYAAFDIERVIERINAAAAKARAAGAPVIIVQHEEDDGPMRFDTEGWQLDDRVAARPEDIRVRKTVTDSFHRTDLHERLESLGVGELVVNLQDVVS